MPNKTDNYNVNDLNKGNNYLKFPIAMLNLDEYIMAGASTQQPNTLFYLKSDSLQTWILTPSGYKDGVYLSAYFGQVWILGPLNYNQEGITIRPSLHLQPDTLVTGEVTMTDPYIVTGLKSEENELFNTKIKEPEDKIIVIKKEINKKKKEMLKMIYKNC